MQFRLSIPVLTQPTAMVLRSTLVNTAVVAALGTLLGLAAAIPAHASFSKIADYKQSTIKHQTIPPPNPGPPTTYTTTIAAPSAIPVGSLIVVGEFSTDPEEMGIVGDTEHNTWHAAVGTGPPTAEPDPAVAIFYTVVTTAIKAGDVITAGGGEVPLEGICAAAWSGVYTASPLGQAGGGQYSTPPLGGPTSCQSPTVQSLRLPSLYVSIIEAEDAGTISIVSPWSSLTGEPGGDGYFAYHEYDSSGSYGATFYTTSQSSAFAACTAEFQGQ